MRSSNMYAKTFPGTDRRVIRAFRLGALAFVQCQEDDRSPVPGDVLVIYIIIIIILG